MPQKTNVTFSSPTLNRLQTLALGAQRSNLMTTITDCDQRDERLGWMGDANLSGDSLALNYDILAYVLISLSFFLALSLSLFLFLSFFSHIYMKICFNVGLCWDT